MKLSNMLAETEYSVLAGNIDCECSALVYDSRKLTKGCVFVCLCGANFDGHDFAAEAATKGASAIIISHEIEIPAEGGVSVVKVQDTRLALSQMAAAWFDYPARKLTTIGVTGTKGKTTTTYLIRSVLEEAGYRVGLVGTVEIIIGEEHIHASNTTPESYLLQEYFHRMVEAGIQVVVMEVSSQALMLHRTGGILFDYGVFTNLEADHIGPNEHTSFEHYLSCKALLFKQCKIGIVNADDAHTEAVIADATCEITSFGLGPKALLRGSNECLSRNGDSLGVSFKIEGLLEGEASVPAPGRFSIYNALAAIAVCRFFDVSLKQIDDGLAKARVRGRIEPIKVSDEFTLLIDYAHNAMALESLLTTLREYKPNRLICLFGCGGNRAKSRRFEMGEVSGRLADLTVITSDNPRFEEPEDIIADIVTGIAPTGGKYIEIPDRKEAIRYVITHGEPGDLIVLAGKGHEDYQEIKGVKYPMDERDLIRDVLADERGNVQG